MDAIENTVDRVLGYVNRNGGWAVFGWRKPGRVDDMAVNEPGSYVHNGDRVTVQSSNLNYHLTLLVPSDPSRIDPNELKLYKVDLTDDDPREQTEISDWAVCLAAALIDKLTIKGIVKIHRTRCMMKFIIYICSIYPSNYILLTVIVPLNHTSKIEAFKSSY